MEVAHSAPMEAPWLSCPCLSYLHTKPYLPSKPILNRLPQWHYQELPPNQNSPLTKTCSIIPSLGDSPTLSLSLNHTHSHPKGNWSLNRPWCPSLNRIRASTELLVKNFFFRLSPQIKVHCNSNSPAPFSTTSTPRNKARKHMKLSVSN